jgi:cell division protein FtsA
VAIRGREVSQSDIDRVMEAAKAVPIPKEQEILHVIPQYFRIDGQEYLTDSIGMHGVRLEAQIHMVTGSVSSARNIIKACELAGIRVTDVVLEQIASAQAVLTPAEREMGVGIIDIGGGTCDFAVYRNGRILHSKVLPVAGNHFTNDLAVGLGIPFNKAEELKRRYGAVCQKEAKNLSNAYLDIDLGYQGGIKTINLESISEILRFRAEEIFDLFVDEILEFRLRNSMPLGFVLTGGGSLLNGIKQLAMDRLDTSVRVGIPEENAEILCNIPDLLKSPIYSTVYGLLLYSIKQKEQNQHYSSEGSTANRIFTRMRSWIYDFF